MKMQFKKTLALFMLTLIVSMPFVFATQINFVYDANGNVVYDGDTFREYNSLNQLSKVFNGSDNTTLLAEYVFHPVEERVLKKVDHVNSETTYYISDSFVVIKNASGTHNLTRVKLNGIDIAESLDGKITYLHTDHLGSVVAETDASGNSIADYTYSPYGERSVLGGAVSSSYGYEGKEHSDVGVDFHFRNYNPEYVLFYQPDTIMPNPYNPQLLNRYMFEAGNPIKHTDPTGHIPNQIGKSTERTLEQFNDWWDSASADVQEAFENNQAVQFAEEVYHASPASSIVSLSKWALYEYIYLTEEAVGAEDDVFRIVSSEEISDKREAAAFSAGGIAIGSSLPKGYSRQIYDVLDKSSGFLEHKNVLQYTWESVLSRVRESQANKRGISISEDPIAAREKYRRAKIRANFPEYCDSNPDDC